MQAPPPDPSNENDPNSNFFSLNSYKNLVSKANPNSKNKSKKKYLKNEKFKRNQSSQIKEEEDESSNSSEEGEKGTNIKEESGSNKENFFTNYALKNNFFRSRVFSIGFFSVFITILSFFVILEISNLTSIVFFNLVETESGDSELMMTKDRKTKNIKTFFTYNESEEYRKEFYRKSNTKDRLENKDHLKDKLTAESKKVLLTKALSGDSDSLQRLLQSNSLTLVEFMELFPEILNDAGLIEPVKIREALFQEMYIDGYLNVMKNEFPDEKEIDDPDSSIRKEAIQEFLATFSGVSDEPVVSNSSRILQEGNQADEVKDTENQPKDNFPDINQNNFQDFLQSQGINPNDIFQSTGSLPTAPKSDENASSSIYSNPALGFKLPSFSNFEIPFDRRDLVGVSGRWIIPANVTNPDLTPTLKNVSETEDEESLEIDKLQINIIVTDLASEIKSGIGRNSDLKDSFAHLKFKKEKEKKAVFRNSAIVSDTIGSYLSLDKNVEIDINFDYFLKKAGFNNFNFEDLINVDEFIKYFGQIKFDEVKNEFYLSNPEEVKAPANLSFISVKDVLDFLNKTLTQAHDLLSQTNETTANLENPVKDQVPVDPNDIISRLPQHSQIDTFVAKFWNDQYISFLNRVAILLKVNTERLANVKLQYNVQGQIRNNKGLYNSLLGNVIFVDRKGISAKIVDNMEQQVSDLRVNLEALIKSTNVPDILNTAFIEPLLDRNISDLRDSIKFMFEGNLDHSLFLRKGSSTNENEVLDHIRKSKFGGVFSFYPLVQIYSPNKDLLYGNLNNFEELSDQFSDSIATKIPNHFSYSYLNPLKLTLSFMNSLHIFLKVLIINIVIVLGVINLIIIYSLTSLAVNEKNFEFGIIRALGMKKTGLLKLISKENNLFHLLADFLSSSCFSIFVHNLRFEVVY